MKIFIATDHAGFDLKNELVLFLEKLGAEVIDEGAHILDEDDDYPDVVALAAKGVSEAALLGDQEVRGIVIGGSGQGEAIVANKFPGVRAVIYYGGSREIIDLSRKHNDSNVLSLGARFITQDEAKTVVEEWINTPFSGEARHARRISRIRDIEKQIKA